MEKRCPKCGQRLPMLGDTERRIADSVLGEGQWDVLPITEKQDKGQEPPPCGDMGVTDGSEVDDNQW